MVSGATGPTGTFGTQIMGATGISGPAYSHSHCGMMASPGVTGPIGGGCTGPAMPYISIPSEIYGKDGNCILYNTTYTPNLKYHLSMNGNPKSCAWLVLKYIAEFPDKIPERIYWGPLVFVIKDKQLDIETSSYLSKDSVHIVEELTPLFKQLYELGTFW